MNTVHTDSASLLTTDIDALDSVPLERLEAEISGFASRLAAATAQWLIWIAAYDRREGWSSWGAKSAAHWLNWQCGVAPRTAREHVAVAHTISDFAELRSVFLEGRLSYSKVRAISRVVEVHNEAELIRLGLDCTASQLERIVGKMPDPDKVREDERTKHGVTSKNNCDGTTTISITVATADSAAAMKAIRTKADQVIARQQGHGETKTEVIDRLGGIQAVRADTAIALITGEVDAAVGVQASVLVVADIETLTGSDDEAEATVDSERVDAAVVQRLCCDGIIQAAVLDVDGTERATGSDQRIVPRRIRRLLERRDHGMCQFPGCESEHRLHAHHVIHWANGGETELTNLISLCHFHHHTVHEGGWNITSDTDGWLFHDTYGCVHRVPVLRLPTNAALPKSEAQSRSIKSGSAGPLAGIGERANLDFVADVLISNTEMRRQRAT